MNGERPLLTAVSVVMALSFAFGGASEDVRVWTSSEGAEVRASLVSADGSSVVLRLESGREAEVAMSRLSEADLRYVERRRTRGRAVEVEPLPAETQAARDIEVEGGPRVFRTPHFEFETDRDVSSAFIAEASAIYEGTYLALSRLPHGLRFRPPGGRDRYRGVFTTDEAFRSLVAAEAPTTGDQRVVGLYLPARRELVVPYSSLGAKELGSRMTLRKSSDTSTLVHEIAHQVMHDWLPLLPTWFSEGLAEYMAAVPYQNGRFEFRNAERGLEDRLERRYRVTEGVLQDVLPPSRWLVEGGREGERPRGKASSLTETAGAEGTRPGETGQWTGTASEYRDAMLFVYFLMHLDQPDQPGAPVGAYFRLVDAAMDQTRQLRRDFAHYEEERRAYNEAVRRFNGRLESFREAAASYNERARRYNRQVARGVPEDERIEVGEAPEEPEPPAELEMPESVERAAERGPVDLVALVREEARPALVRGRAPREIDAAMKAAYERMGLELFYRD